MFEVQAGRVGLNEFATLSRVKLSAVEPKRLSRAEAVTCYRIRKADG